ncbi:hypothetical protein [Sporomusa termitida]|uniref:Uncharacterized protein n=1 Tax=Sporomusa termitida TaxID=2377 RepID=A0A517DVD5_9FIRM|nr:hypothetical protein [Sporomusa termitida]QDR81291.1 hypothetical protein SPTER_26680 [Sporomusa termitida]
MDNKELLPLVKYLQRAEATEREICFNIARQVKDDGCCKFKCSCNLFSNRFGSEKPPGD